MLKVIFVVLFVAAAFAVYKWFTAVKTEVEQDVGAVEAAVQTDAKTAEAETVKVVADIKAKL